MPKKVIKMVKFLYLHHEDSSRCCPSEKGRWYR